MKRWMGGLCLGAGLMFAGTADALTIDTFNRVANSDPALGDVVDDGDGFVAFAIPGSPIQIAADGPIGGVRTLGVVTGASTRIAVRDGELGFSAGPFGPAEVEVSWDGGGFGLGGADLTLENDELEFTVVIGDLVDLGVGSSIGLKVTLTDTSGVTAFLLGTITVPDQVVSFPLVDFVNLDETSVDRIALTLSGDTAVDLLVIDLVAAGGPDPETIPVPLALALFASGLLGFAAAARR